MLKMMLTAGIMLEIMLTAGIMLVIMSRGRDTPNLPPCKEKRLDSLKTKFIDTRMQFWLPEFES